jgi:hypothetical protein
MLSDGGFRRVLPAGEVGAGAVSLVAGITKVQMGELKGRDVLTLAALAQLPLPLSWKPERGVA